MYDQIGEQLEARAAEIRETIAELELNYQAELERNQVELEQLAAALEKIFALQQNFGAHKRKSHSQPPKPAPNPGRKPAPSRPSAIRSHAGGGSAGTKRGGKGDRVGDKQKVRDYLKDRDWQPTGAIKRATGLSSWRYTMATRDLLADEELERSGSNASLAYRLRTGAPAPADPPPPPADPPPPPASNSRGTLTARVLDCVDRHAHADDSEIARHLGRGTKDGQREVSAELRELAEEGRLAYTDTGKGRLWRMAGKPPPKLGAVLQTHPDAGGGERSPQTELEKDILRAVAGAAKSVPRIAEEIGARNESVSSAANSMCSRKILKRGIRGTETIFGRAGR